MARKEASYLTFKERRADDFVSLAVQQHIVSLLLTAHQDAHSPPVVELVVGDVGVQVHAVLERLQIVRQTNLLVRKVVACGGEDC